MSTYPLWESTITYEPPPEFYLRGFLRLQCTSAVLLTGRSKYSGNLTHQILYLHILIVIGKITARNVAEKKG
ncbi:MAG: hypothetical protein WBA22_05740 [Candidatus Methanofastidiosia archaeon]